MERERITISIKKKLLSAIDDTIDGVNVRNRSHALETLASKALNLSESKNAVILIGGDNALKTIPMVENNLNQLAKNGFEKVYIAVGYLGDKIKGKLGDGEKFDLELEYLEGGEGSGGALLQLKNLFKNTFLVYNFSDDSNELSLDRLLDFHKKHKSLATIITNNIEELNGIYIMEPDCFEYIPKGFSMLETDIFPKINADSKLVIYPII